MPELVFAEPGLSGFRAGTLATGSLLRRSSDMTIHGDLPTRRPGFLIHGTYANLGSPTQPCYVEWMPLDEEDNTRHGAIVVGTDFLEAGTWTDRGNLATNPYAATTTPRPRWIFYRDRIMWVHAGEYKLLQWRSGALVVLDDLPDFPASGGSFSVSAVTGGSIPDGDYNVRIRWYDSNTGTYGGPNNRTGSTSYTVNCGSGNNTIRVSIGTVPTRATHYQVQITTTNGADLPGSYEIIGNATFTDGLVTVATSPVDFTAAPATGAAFEYRTNGVFTVYRHSNAPTNAGHITHRGGRAYWASFDASWLVFSEADNPEHSYFDPDDPGGPGFNSIDPEGFVDTLPGPCTMLAANEDAVYYGWESGMAMVTGSMQPVFDSNNYFVDREYGVRVIAQGTNGPFCPDYAVVDNDIYFVSEDGLKIIRGAAIVPLDIEAIRHVWDCKLTAYARRWSVKYIPNLRLVLVAFTTGHLGTDGLPDKVLAYHPYKNQWCPPWNLHVTSLTLHRFSVGGTPGGHRLFFGSPYGTINIYDYGDGDGWDGSNDDAELTATSTTATSADVSGKAWTTNQFTGYGLVLVHPTTGAMHYRTIKTNDADTLNWDGSLATGVNWLVYIGGIPQQEHVAVMNGGKEFVVEDFVTLFVDIPSMRAD